MDACVLLLVKGQAISGLPSASPLNVQAIAYRVCIQQIVCLKVSQVISLVLILLALVRM